MAIRKSIHALLSGILYAFDILGVYIGYMMAFFIYDTLVGHSPQDFQEISQLALVPALVTFISFILGSVYRCLPGPLGLNQLRRLLSAYFWSGLLTLSVLFFTKSQGFSRIMVSMGFILGLFYVFIGRAIFIRITEPIRSTYRLNRRILILGAGQVGRTLARNLIINSPSGFELVGFLDDLYPNVKSVNVKVGDREFVLPILGALADLDLECRRTRASEVIVAMTKVPHSIHQDLFEKVKDLHIAFSIVPSALELMLTGAEAYSIGRIPLFRLGEKPQFILSPLLKRTMDLIGASAIGVLSSPIWVLSWLWIRIDSPGPALFVHERVGKGGKKFNFYKFRSMHLTADPYAVTPQNQRDPRITKSGAVLRRLSIDEIPQLINVLKGEMSLVGPRPEMPFIVEGYDEMQKLRLSVKPGLTGVWQISADRANPIHENIDYDLYYLENQSLWLDLAILVRTFVSVLKGVGAY